MKSEVVRIREGRFANLEGVPFAAIFAEVPGFDDLYALLRVRGADGGPVPREDCGAEVTRKVFDWMGQTSA